MKKSIESAPSAMVRCVDAEHVDVVSHENADHLFVLIEHRAAAVAGQRRAVEQRLIAVDAGNDAGRERVSDPERAAEDEHSLATGHGRPPS
jgi:hypothetical protein